jgi:hypothetical protein
MSFVLDVLLIVGGIVIGFIIGAYTRKKFDMKGWELADKYRSLYDELLNETVALQEAMQGELNE